MRPVNIEAACISAVKAATGVPVSVSVPAQRPPRFVRIRRMGGSMELVQDAPTVLVEAWDATALAAFDLCADALVAIQAMEGRFTGDVWVDSVEVGSPVPLDDPETALPRYQATITIRCADRSHP